jgi:hypothetical protein
MNQKNDTPTPVVCTLTTKDRASQSLQWNDLRGLARSGETIPTGARTTYNLEHADAIEDLARREIGCCGSWLDIRITRDDVLTLVITTENPEGVDLIRNIAGVEKP